MKQIFVAHCPHCDRDIYKDDRRGTATKFEEADVRKAIQQLGDEARQADVAAKLQVTTRTMMRWAERNGFPSWKAVKAQYGLSTIWSKGVGRTRIKGRAIAGDAFSPKEAKQ